MYKNDIYLLCFIFRYEHGYGKYNIIIDTVLIMMILFFVLNIQE